MNRWVLERKSGKVLASVFVMAVFVAIAPGAWTAETAAEAGQGMDVTTTGPTEGATGVVPPPAAGVGVSPGVYPTVPPVGVTAEDWEAQRRDWVMRAQQTADSLRNDAVIKEQGIEVHSIDGRIIVLGMVPDDATKERVDARLDEFAKNAPLERHVEVAQDKPRTDQEIQEAIESQFFWSLSVDGTDIRISVQGGTATLTGSVDSYDEKLNASENAYEAGARRVINDLVVSERGPDAGTIAPADESRDLDIVDDDTGSAGGMGDTDTDASGSAEM